MLPPDEPPLKSPVLGSVDPGSEPGRVPLPDAVILVKVTFTLRLPDTALERSTNDPPVSTMGRSTSSDCGPVVLRSLRRSIVAVSSAAKVREPLNTTSWPNRWVLPEVDKATWALEVRPRTTSRSSKTEVKIRTRRRIPE